MRWYNPETAGKREKETISLNSSPAPLPDTSAGSGSVPLCLLRDSLDLERASRVPPIQLPQGKHPAKLQDNVTPRRVTDAFRY